MSTKQQVIRLSITSDVRKALDTLKQEYPALSDAEILKLGLSKEAAGRRRNSVEAQREIRHTAAAAAGTDYLEDPEENIYDVSAGTRVNFS